MFSSLSNLSHQLLPNLAQLISADINLWEILFNVMDILA
jgi:hypothetical protein